MKQAGRSGALLVLRVGRFDLVPCSQAKVAYQGSRSASAKLASFLDNAEVTVGAVEEVKYAHSSALWPTLQVAYRFNPSTGTSRSSILPLGSSNHHENVQSLSTQPPIEPTRETGLEPWQILKKIEKAPKTQTSSTV
jgi:hypothetical protein